MHRLLERKEFREKTIAAALRPHEVVETQTHKVILTGAMDQAHFIGKQFTEGELAKAYSRGRSFIVTRSGDILNSERRPDRFKSHLEPHEVDVHLFQHLQHLDALSKIVRSAGGKIVSGAENFRVTVEALADRHILETIELADRQVQVKTQHTEGQYEVVVTFMKPRSQK